MTIASKVRHLGLLTLVFLGAMVGQLPAQSEPMVSGWSQTIGDCTSPTTQMAMNFALPNRPRPVTNNSTSPTKKSNSVIAPVRQQAIAA